MRTKLFFTCIFSLLFGLATAQTEQSDSVTVKPKWHYQPNFLVGFDLLNAGLAPFTPRKVFQGFVSSQFSRNLRAVLDGGFERNAYKKNGYDATAKGFFLKPGVLYSLVKDPDNSLNGLYAGGKLGFSLFSQEYAAVPIRGFQGGDQSASFPSATETAYWVEASVGGRVQLFKSKFYVDVNLQPRYLAYATKQEHIVPMIVPGFGKSSAKFNVGFAWNIAYSF